MQHPELVKNLKKSPLAIADTLNFNRIDMIHMALGIAGEAGETAEALAELFDTPTVECETAAIKEMGDLEFYLEGLRQAAGIEHEEVVEAMPVDDIPILNPYLGALKIASSAGELVDVVKKYTIFNKPYNKTGLIKAMAKVELHLFAAREAHGFSREQVLEGNIAKLTERYNGTTYSDEAATARFTESAES